MQAKESTLKLHFVGLGALCQVLEEEREKGFIGKDGVLNKEASCKEIVEFNSILLIYFEIVIKFGKWSYYSLSDGREVGQHFIQIL